MDEFLFGFVLGLCMSFFGWAYLTNNMYQTYVALTLAVVCLFILLFLGINQK